MMLKMAVEASKRRDGENMLAKERKNAGTIAMIVEMPVPNAAARRWHALGLAV